MATLLAAQIAWFELDLPKIDDDAIQSTSSIASAEECIARWWKVQVNDKIADLKRTTNSHMSSSNGKRKIIEWNTIRLERIGGSDDKHQTHLAEFIKQPIRKCACLYPSRIFVLFWGWKKKHESLRVYGGIFPKYIWDKSRSHLSDLPLKQTLHKSVLGDRDHLEVSPALIRLPFFSNTVAVPAPPITTTSTDNNNNNTTTTPSTAVSLQSGLNAPCLDWIKNLRQQPERFIKDAFYLVSEPDTSNPDCKHFPYDGSYSMLFRPDEIFYYIEYMKRFFYCVTILSSVESGETTKEEEAFKTMEGYMLEPNLSDPKERELDFKSRLLCSLFAAHLMLKARSKKKSELASDRVKETTKDKDNSIFAQIGEDRSAVESMAKAMLQTLAYQLEVRSKYLFSNEGDAIRLATYNGSIFATTENTCANDRDVVFDLWERDKFVEDRNKIRSRKSSDEGIILCGSKKVQEALLKRISLYSNGTDLDQDFVIGLKESIIVRYKRSDIVADHWASDFKRGISCSVRFDSENNIYAIASEPLEWSLERVYEKTAGEENETSMTEELAQSYPIVSAFRSSASKSAANMHQVLLGDLPVIFFMLWEANNCHKYGEVLSFVIDWVIHNYRYQKIFGKESILYYGIEKKRLQNSDFRIQSCNGHNFTMILLPELVFTSNNSLCKFIACIKCALASAYTLPLSKSFVLSQDTCTTMADWIYPSENKVLKPLFIGNECYTPGFVFKYLNNATFGYEIHPSLTEFHVTIYTNSNKHDPIIGIVNRAPLVYLSIDPTAGARRGEDSESCAHDDNTTTTTSLSENVSDETKMNVDIHLLPYSTKTKEVWDRSETWRFIKQQARSYKAPLPDNLLLITKLELNHGSLVYGAQNYSKRSCLYESKCSSPCTTCGHGNLMGTEDNPHELYQFINYKEVPMWQFASLLTMARTTCKELDMRYKGEATAGDFDTFLEKEAGLGEIWKAVKRIFELNLQSYKEFRVEMQIDYETLRRDINESRSMIQQERKTLTEEGEEEAKSLDQDSSKGGGGGIDLAANRRKYDNEVKAPPSIYRSLESKVTDNATYTPELKDRIKKYIGLHPEGLYSKFKGENFKRFPKELRWGNKCSFSVQLENKSVFKNGVSLFIPAGGWYDWESGKYGDIFKFIMMERYKSEDTKTCFTPAVMFCHSWVLKTFGLDALSKDPSERFDLPGTVELSAAENSHYASSQEYRCREARTLWKSANPFDVDPRKGSKEGIGYMKSTRGIYSHRILFSGTFRYHPAFPLVDRGEALTYGAVITSLINPLDKAREVKGVHAIFIDEVAQKKVEYLEQQKKNRGEWMGNGVAIQVVTNEAQIATAFKEFHCRVAIGEGVETMCSVAEAVPELEVWALLGINNIGSFPYLGGSEPGMTILYCADNDGSDAKHKEKLDRQIKKLTDKGYVVYLSLPEVINSKDKTVDFNDILVKITPRSDALEKIRYTLKCSKIYASTVPKPVLVAVKKEGGEEEEVLIKSLPKKAKSSPATVEDDAIQNLIKKNTPKSSLSLHDKHQMDIDQQFALAEQFREELDIGAKKTTTVQNEKKKAQQEKLAELLAKKKSKTERKVDDDSEEEEVIIEKKKKKHHHQKKTTPKAPLTLDDVMIFDENAMDSFPTPPPVVTSKTSSTKKGHVIDDDGDE